jgi:geranylgeranyl pyrophosphate synthase
LKDWQEDDGNKLIRGTDVLGGRPTVLLALALESLPPTEQAELMVLIDAHDQPAARRIDRIDQLYRAADVYEKARRLVEKHQQRASAVANAADPPELRRLLHYLLDSVLERPSRESSVPLVTEIAAPWSPTVPS